MKDKVLNLVLTMKKNMWSLVGSNEGNVNGWIHSHFSHMKGLEKISIGACKSEKVRCIPKEALRFLLREELQKPIKERRDLIVKVWVLH